MNTANLYLNLKKGSQEEQQMLNKGYSHVAVPSFGIDYWSPPSLESLPVVRSSETPIQSSPSELYSKVLEEKNLYDAGRRSIQLPSGKQVWLIKDPNDQKAIWKEETTGIPFYDSLDQQRKLVPQYEEQLKRLGK